MARTLSVVDVVFRGRTAQFTRSLNRAESQTQAFARRSKLALKAVGIAAAGAGASLAAMGTKAVQAASEFESGMTKVNTLVGLSRERVRGMRDDVLAMAADTGQAPDELTEALFRLTSGGIRGTEVLESLRKAAQGARIGMGDAGEIARIATSSVQAFKDAGVDLSEALNVMLGTIREGNVRVNRLQSAFGQLQSVAADAGVTIQDMGAFLAVTSRTMGDTQKAARGLRQFLVRLQDPTGDLPEAFEKAGTSIAEFRQEIIDRGLPAALVDLARGAERNNVEFAKLIGSTRALPAVLAAARNNAEDFLQISDRMEHSQQAFDSAVSETAKTLNDLKNRVSSTWEVFKITLGERLAPLARDLLNAFRANMPQIGQVVASSMATMLGVVRRVIDFFHNAMPEIGIGGLVGFLFLGPKGAAIGGLIGKLIAENTLRLKQALNLLPGKEVEFNPLERALLDAEKIREKMRNLQTTMRNVSQDETIPSNVKPVLLNDLNRRMNALQQRLQDTKDRAQQAMREGFETSGHRAVDTVDRLLDRLEQTQRRLREIARSGFQLPGGGAGTGGGGGLFGGLSPAMMRSLLGIPSPTGVMGMLPPTGGGGEDRGGGIPSEIPGAGATDVFRRGKEKMSGFTNALRSGLLPAITSLTSASQSAASTVFTLASSILRTLGQFLPGPFGAIGGIFGAFAGAFQHGGTIPRNQFGLVGESGPELVSGPAEVQPANISPSVTLDLGGASPLTRWALANDPNLQQLLSDADDVGRQTGRIRMG